MISYKVKGIILAVILSLASIMMPFSVYADTISNSNVNINYYLDSVTETASGSYMQTYTVEFIFDQSYLGWISSKMVGTYIVDNNVPITTSQFTKTQAIYVNGTIAKTSFSFVTQNTQNGGALQSLSQSIQNSNVTPLADLSTLDDILNILTDINNNIEIDVIQELQSIVANTSLANTYLQILTQLRQWNIPVESLTALWYSFQNYSSKIVDIYNNGYWNYPIFSLNSNDIIINQYFNANILYDVVFIVYNVGVNSSDIPVVFNLDGGTSSNYAAIGLGRTFRIFRFKIKYDTAGYHTISTNWNIKITPVYFGNNNNISTDFALEFGLSNRLLDNIQIIANGTSQSNSAASDLESEASEYSDIADDVIGVEEGLTSNFETEVNKIDLDTGLNVFGGNFMTSATWVRTQFDRLTENTPYGSLVVYGLTLGFALLMLGKVFL